jgi:adenylate kinase
MGTVKDFNSFKSQNINERVLPDKQGKIFVILGAPGSGKGTLSKELAKKYGFVHISTGDLIRNSDNEELKEIIAGGKLVPDSMMIKILKSELKNTDLTKNIIFDGFPRTLKQGPALDSLLGKLGLGLSKVIFMELDEKEAKARIKKRAKKEGRADDASEETVNKRFEEYEEKTLPLIDFYRKSRKLLRINAGLGKDEVLNRVVERFKLKKPE